MTTEEKFHAAVNVIRNLPKNGSYQPSHELMLRFYAYFKQATLGPCNTSRPGFWDPVGRYKYDAHKALGNMPKEQAMRRYVEELHSIVETLSYSEGVKNFLEAGENEIDSVDFSDLEKIAPDVMKRVRSQSNSPMRRSFRYLKELQKALILLSTLSTCLWAQGLCGGPDVPNHGLPPVRLTFHTARQLWDTVHVGHCLFVALPSSIPEGSRESFLALLEAAEEQLKCQYVILVFEKTRPDLTKLIHTFMFLGFTVLSPTATILPPSLTANNVCMLYRIE